jgi:hypothetical protein
VRGHPPQVVQVCLGNGACRYCRGMPQNRA